MLLAFITHTDQHYRRGDGTPTREAGEFRQVAGLVRRLYGRTRAADFGPLALKAARASFLDRGWCRTLVNKRTNRVRRIFKWAVGEELVPGAVWQGLRAVERFQAGRTSAPKTDPAGPVPLWAVNATLPDLRPEVQAMVEFQRLTGCRPGDTIRQRPAPGSGRRRSPNGVRVCMGAPRPCPAATASAAGRNARRRPGDPARRLLGR